MDVIRFEKLYVAHNPANTEREQTPAAGFHADVQALAGNARRNPDDLELLVQLAAGLSGRTLADSATTHLLAIYADHPASRALIGQMCLKLASICDTLSSDLKKDSKTGLEMRSVPEGWKATKERNPLSDAKLPSAILYLAGREPQCPPGVTQYVEDELGSRLNASMNPGQQGDREFGKSLLNAERFVTHQELYGCVGEDPCAPVHTFSINLAGDAAGLEATVKSLKTAADTEPTKTHLVFVNTGGHWTLMGLAKGNESYDAVYFDSLGGGTHSAGLYGRLRDAGLEINPMTAIDKVPLQTEQGLWCACGPLALMAAQKVQDLQVGGNLEVASDALQAFASEFAAKPTDDRQAAVIAERARMLAVIEAGARRQAQAGKAF